MRSRKELALALIERSETVSLLMKDLQAFGWDSGELVALTPTHIIISLVYP